MAAGVQAAIEGQLEQMGFAGERVRTALERLGSKASVEEVLETLLSSNPGGAQAAVPQQPLAPGAVSAPEVIVVKEPSTSSDPSAAKKPSALMRGLSKNSQQVFDFVTSRHAGVSHAAVARLLLRAAAALRQGLLSEEQRGLLLNNLERGQVDLVHEIIAGVGVRSEPAMPLDVGEARWECSVCFAEQDEQGWRCPGSHRYCSGCMRRHAESTAFPRCPTVGCGYELAEADFRLLNVPRERLEAFRRAKLEGAVEALASSGSGAASSSGAAVAGGGRGRESGERQEVVIRCPNPSCKNAVLVAKGDRRSYSCACGASPFCTHCRQSPYHYHAECSDVQALRRRWLDWVSGGRDAHRGEAEKSEAFEGQARALREGLERHTELEADEDWKAKHCRCCPSCSRTVQKLSGCDAMVCGADAHGGNDQPGCGQSFSWSSAPRYKAKLESRKLPKITAEEARCRGRDALHAFVDCSLCGSGGKGIRGPRFRCIHCRSFDACSECETKLAELHSPDHVFEVMFESDFEWGSLRLPRGTRVRVVRRGQDLPAHLGGGPLPESAAKRGLEGLCGAIAKKPRKREREEPPAQFQWQSDRGRWHNYGKAANAEIVAAARDGHSRVRVLISGTRYEVDLDRMRQRNVATRGFRPVRPAPEALAVAAAASRRAAEVEASSCRVLLDAGGEVLLAAKHLEPILASRAEAEKLMEVAMAAGENGEVDEDSEPRARMEDAEGEEEEDCEAEEDDDE
uniref:Uncharacterized protein n=1 Tax=Alexandrium monilatum TaxID=311494 RepID=A0A7S4S3C3_9DINO